MQSVNTVYIDNGHGVETPGKRSPNGVFREYSWCRAVAVALKVELEKIGIKTVLVCPEATDIPIGKRVKRVNSSLVKGDNSICISIHNNAAGDGSQWMLAQGWSAHVALNASKNSKKLADCLVDSAKELGVKIRPYSPGQKFWVQNLGICRDTNCPAVLTENLFMDNKADMEYLQSKEGFNKMLQIHINGIKKYFGV